jgi:hypothetical protein
MGRIVASALIVMENIVKNKRNANINNGFFITITLFL